LDQQDVCLGCGRVLIEITGWHQASLDEKQRILQRAQQRLAEQSQDRLKRRAATPPE
jgi:predicted Fe-S protein YdhL (DUF1289 family)